MSEELEHSLFENNIITMNSTEFRATQNKAWIMKKFYVFGDLPAKFHFSDMSKGRLDFRCFLLFLCFQIAIADDRDNILDELITDSKTPVIALFYDKDKEQLSQVTNDLTPHVQPLRPPHDRKVYLLYHILRTTQENENLDDEAAKKLEETEDILREALRVRCGYLDTCVKRCPPKKKYVCKVTCQEEYDDYDVCNRPKKSCSSPKCGVTKPAYWKILRERM